MRPLLESESTDFAQSDPVPMMATIASRAIY
jgi:hypothetical protein